MSLSLFDLSNEFFALKDLIDNDLEVNEETGEITDNSELLKELFENLKLSFEDKLDNAQRYCLTLDGEADILDKEIKRLQAKKQVLHNKKDRLKKLMLSSIECAGFSKIKTPFYSFNIKNSESLEVESIDNIPREFLRIKKEADKTAIKKAIKDETPKVGYEYKNENDEIFILTEIENDIYTLGSKVGTNEKYLSLEDLKNDFKLTKGFVIDGCKIVENKSLVTK